MAGHAGPAGLDGVGDLRDGVQVQLADLAADVGLAQGEALADDAALLLLVGVDVDPQFPQVDAAALGPVEDGRFQGLGAHHRAVDLLLRQPAEKLDDVLVLHLQRLDRRIAPLLDQRAEGLRGGDGRGAAEGQVAGLGDHVLRRVGRMTPHPEGETHGVAADDRAVLAEAVGIVDLAQVRPRLAVDGVHEELLGLLAILPSHGCPPLGFALVVFRRGLARLVQIRRGRRPTPAGGPRSDAAGSPAWSSWPCFPPPPTHGMPPCPRPRCGATRLPSLSNSSNWPEAPSPIMSTTTAPKRQVISLVGALCVWVVVFP